MTASVGLPWQPGPECCGICGKLGTRFNPIDMFGVCMVCQPLSARGSQPPLEICVECGYEWSRVEGPTLAQCPRCQAVVALFPRPLVEERPKLEGELIAYRRWALVGHELCSSNVGLHSWALGEVNHAVCLRTRFREYRAVVVEEGPAVALAYARNLPPDTDHAAPHEDCDCGLYALYSNWDTAHQRFVCDGPAIYGVVQCWGRTLLHGDGLRAEHVKVVALSSPDEGSELKRVRALAEEFGVPLVRREELTEIGAQFGQEVPLELRPAPPLPRYRRDRPSQSAWGRAAALYGSSIEPSSLIEPGMAQFKLAATNMYGGGQAFENLQVALGNLGQAAVKASAGVELTVMNLQCVVGQLEAAFALQRLLDREIRWTVVWTLIAVLQIVASALLGDGSWTWNLASLLFGGFAGCKIGAHGVRAHAAARQLRLL